MKLAAERTLSDKQIEDLGLFRQAYQTLRQSIRDDVLPNFGPNNGIYVVFGELAGRVGCIIDFAKKPDWLVTLAEDPEVRPSDELATANLQMILTKFRSGELKNAVDKKEVALRKNR